MDGVLNATVAARLREAAELLQAQGANPFRVSAYRRAADTVEALEDDLKALVERGGMAALEALPGIGRGIAAAVFEMVGTGRWGQLDRLRGTSDPVRLLQTVPGIGPGLARRIHGELHVDRLPELEAAAWDGRLADLPGLGPRRVASIRAALGAMLGRVRRERPPAPRSEPTVAELLAVDADYRGKAGEGELPRIAPQRFNPEHRAWLSILHTTRGPWHFTAMYSNTARAHELGKTDDWVVVYFYDDHHDEGQRTVVTETRGPLAGRRVVRGREAECRALAAQEGAAP